jgi:hypothetical protein
MTPFYPTLRKPAPHPELVDSGIRTIRNSGAASLTHEAAHAVADAAEAWRQYEKWRDEEVRRVG